MWTGGIYDNNIGKWIWSYSGGRMPYSRELKLYQNDNNDKTYDYVLKLHAWDGTPTWNDAYENEEQYYVCES